METSKFHQLWQIWFFEWLVDIRLLSRSPVRVNEGIALTAPKKYADICFS